MIEFLWDLHQQKGISEAKTDASRAKQDARSQAAHIRSLEFSVQRMSLVSQALWELLRTRFQMSEEELLAKIQEIDLRDGKLDNRISPQANNCPSCNRILSTKNVRCIYCGTEVQRPHVFQ